MAQWPLLLALALAAAHVAVAAKGYVVHMCWRRATPPKHPLPQKWMHNNPKYSWVLDLPVTGEAPEQCDIYVMQPQLHSRVLSLFKQVWRLQGTNRVS